MPAAKPRSRTHSAKPFRPHPDHDRLPVADGLRDQIDRCRHARNNAAPIAEAASEFKVSIVLTTVAEKTFPGPMFDEIKSTFPAETVIDRTSMNTC